MIILNINFLYDVFHGRTLSAMHLSHILKGIFMSVFEVLNNRADYNTAKVNQVLCDNVKGYEQYAFRTALGQKQHQQALGLVMKQIQSELKNGQA